MRRLLFCGLLVAACVGPVQAAKLSNVYGTVTTTALGGASRLVTDVTAGEVQPGSIVTAGRDSGAIVNYRNGCFQVVQPGQSVQVERSPVCNCTAAETRQERAKGGASKKCVVVPGANRWQFAPAVLAAGVAAGAVIAANSTRGSGRRGLAPPPPTGSPGPLPPGPGGQPALPNIEGRNALQSPQPVSP